MSDQIDYQIKGLDKLNKKLKRLQGKEIKDALHKTTDKAVKYVHSQVPEYPAPPPASTYRRTGTLGRQITTAVLVFSGCSVACVYTFFDCVSCFFSDFG